MVMKLGDVVRQNAHFVRNGKKGPTIAGGMLGTVVAIHGGLFPENWDLSENQKAWSKRIGRRIDVLWANGKLTESFAESSLEEVISREIL
jgi:hypothetical protein